MCVAASDVDDDAVSSRRVNPFTVVFQAGASTDGADDAVGGDGGRHGALDNVFKRVAHVAAALLIEAHGVGMAVNASEAGEIVVIIQSKSITPVNEGFLDGFAFGVRADGAEALVTFGIDGVARGGFAPSGSALVHVGSPLRAKSAPTDANTGGGGELLRWNEKEFS